MLLQEYTIAYTLMTEAKRTNEEVVPAEMEVSKEC